MDVVGYKDVPGIPNLLTNASAIMHDALTVFKCFI